MHIPSPKSPSACQAVSCCAHASSRRGRSTGGEREKSRPRGERRQVQRERVKSSTRKVTKSSYVSLKLVVNKVLNVSNAHCSCLFLELVKCTKTPKGDSTDHIPLLGGDFSLFSSPIAAEKTRTTGIKNPLEIYFHNFLVAILRSCPKTENDLQEISSIF